MPAKTDRLEMRLTAEQKALLERAAAISGQRLTGFALSHLLGRAHEILERHERTVLSRRGQEQFLRMLESPESPVPALREALRRRGSGRA